MDILEGLDPDQSAAASAPDGPVRIIAGAGTGKTTTLAARIAYLIAERGVSPESIAAVTFTNKAARELRERVGRKVGDAAAGLRIGTFHALSCRLLRRHAEAAGLRDARFTVLDEDEARNILTTACQCDGAFGPFVPPEGDAATASAAKKAYLMALSDFVQAAAHQIGLWKVWGLSDEMAADHSAPSRLPHLDERLVVAYRAYQYELESRNAVDFGDLLLRAVRMLRENDTIREQEARAVRHLLVDEGQDANPVQVEWVKLLSSWHGAVTVVGDEDQSIYGFQGGYPGAMADMVGSNAFEFELRTNRRCTKQILEPANYAVEYNRNRKRKVLIADRDGPPVEVTAHLTEAQEAAWIAGRIQQLVDGGTKPDEIAILLRSSWLMPPFEEALALRGIGAVVTSGSSILQREEVKDILAYVRLAVNPFDDIAFRRIANRPIRGLGPAAVEAICMIAAAQNIPFYEACQAAAHKGTGAKLKKDAVLGASGLGRALALLAEDGKWSRPAYDVVTTALQATGYLEHVENTKDAKGGSPGLVYVELVRKLSDPYDDANAFLQEIALLTDAELQDQRGKVRISTIHAAKGLEFDHVFCPGFDEGVMPNGRAVSEEYRGTPGDPWNGPANGGLEEERRLAHVAFTRARKTLNISFPWRRKKRGKTGPSVLIPECNLDFIEADAVSSAELGRKRSPARKGRIGFDR